MMMTTMGTATEMGTARTTGTEPLLLDSGLELAVAAKWHDRQPFQGMPTIGETPNFS